MPEGRIIHAASLPFKKVLLRGNDLYTSKMCMFRADLAIDVAIDGFHRILSIIS
jgi:hypothetical protein